MTVTTVNRCDICGRTDCAHLSQRLAACVRGEKEEDKISREREQPEVTSALRKLRIAESNVWILEQVKGVRLKKEKAALAIRLDRCYGLAIALGLVGRKRSFENRVSSKTV